ncbi:NAD-dependent epimerase/dehydratase family protein [Spirilliplanes yamanashiensis]|uniref:NAD-dependent epimerase n=1 Tax=Spirilliplanes yamanashiensis TaxID=42233 RepID=A0A8J4DJ63_9ACTN|nr:NAD-dependent epimerase/dehydratase family protein [Spirilliplanes yamanashiensis]MDP9816883.1 nucleoside-diphosphate-sugar epimerase [Spirilliplanes yamanashiensis]GIJ03461.1 NAD-dependent epimerase [Spirilliplanes yamanashiensis]
MTQHVIVGAGPVGTAVARQLAGAGEAVRVITRSGGGPEHPLVERVAADASDAARLTALTRGAEVIYNCVNPAYTRWPTDWPPISAALVAAARASGAVLATTGNLYGYGPVDGPMTEDTPLAATGRKGRVRIRMWQDALASGVRTVEARGSDYLGVGAASVFSMVLFPAMRSGRAAWMPGDPDVPHSFTYTGDMARTLIALARDERAWGRAWHVPSPPPVTVRELAARFAEVGGLPPVRVRTLPRGLLRAAGLVVPMARELVEMDYQFWAPFVLDSSAVTRTFGLTPTALDDVLRELAGSAPAVSGRGR